MKAMRALACSLVLAGALPVHASGGAVPQTVAAALAEKQALASTRLRIWGFEVYDARLWARPGFDLPDFETLPFALELAYLRNFKGADIARRSIDEMRQAGPLDEADAARWLEAMTALFPDVRRGDRITGVHLPGSGARFYLNDRLLGEVAEDRFSRRFFGIWLSERTSQPRMREALLAQLRSPDSGNGSAPEARGR